MLTRKAVLCNILVWCVTSTFAQAVTQDTAVHAVKGTLVVAVPITEGLVVCSDKRLYNHQTRTFTDTFVKIHEVSKSALFVATHTVGFLDKQTGKVGFDAFQIGADYVARHEFSPNRQFWDGLRKEIRKQLLAYLATQKFRDWPETDVESNGLLFNLVFYVATRGTSRSFTIKVFYEKARTPIISVSNAVSEEIKTPKLGGKGRDVMNYLARDLNLRRDPFILQFDQSNFTIQKIARRDAVEFARRLFVLTNAALPKARVSATYDCAFLDYEKGFQWINGSGQSGSISNWRTR